jgi:EAL and modified HD-GYP domain-containing signal transduction protein
MDVFVARQPIFDVDKNIYAYELLFRSGMSNAFPDIDGETATSSLLSSSFFTVGIDKISGGKKVFINFTEQLLKQGTAEMFPAEKVVVEILEDVPATEDIVKCCLQLAQTGYTLALDDFVYDKNLQPLIELAAIIKIDFRLTPMTRIKQLVHDLKEYDCQLLAEKVETYQEFEQALALGFTYFQGYFFSRPEVLRNKEITTSQLKIMQLICEVNGADFNIDKIEHLITQDVSTSYKMLNYLNSAYFSRSQPLSSIRQAIVFLGERGVRLFVSLIATSRLAEDKPHELIKTSIIRARFLEQIGLALHENSGELFMLGLFSLLDAMLDNPMDYLLGKLPLPESVNNALIHRTGELFPYLKLVEKYEKCQWSCVDSQLAESGIPAEKIMDFYLDAVTMADVY